jgi:hypothetical protein
VDSKSRKKAQTIGAGDERNEQIQAAAIRHFWHAAVTTHANQSELYRLRQAYMRAQLPAWQAAIEAFAEL